jgi:amino acid adenylation domain-containing protein
VNEALDILNSLASCGVSVWAEGSRIRFRAAKGGVPDELKERLTAHKGEVLAAWRERAASEATCDIATHGQRALWFLYQDAPGSPAYNIAIPLRILSKVDLPAMEKACQALVDRHPSFRTTYAMDGGGLVQRVRGHAPVSFRTHDRTGTDLQGLRDELIDNSRVPFDLETGPVIRVDLFTRAEDDHILLVTVHHIAVDGWSGVLLMEDLRLNYIAETNPDATPPPRPEKDVPAYARWQAGMLSSAEGEAHEKYWTHSLAGEIPVLNLSTDWPRPAVSSGRGESVPIDLGAEVSGEVRALARAAGTTPFTVLLAAYHALLHRYTRSEQTIVGSPTYGRNQVEFSGVIGYFVNTIPLKADFHGDLTFRELLAQMRNRVLDGLDHQDYPFALLVEKLHPDRHASRTPIFQTLFALQRNKQVAGLNYVFSSLSGETRIDFGGLLVESFAIPNCQGQFDLALELFDLGGVYRGHVSYSTDLFSAAAVSEFAVHYGRLLQAMTTSPDAKISELTMLPPDEEHRILREWNNTARDYPRDVCIHELIAAQVDRTPDSVAVVFEGQRLTYRELDMRANQLAHYLRKRGVTAETRVGLCMERSAEMVIGILGILKAGGAYVPIDPSYPEARVAYMLGDAGVEIVLAQKQLEHLLKAATTEIVCLDADWSRIARESADRPENRARSGNLAYMIYTSGSTGRPKSIMIEHRSIVNQTLWMQDKFRLTASDAMLQKAPYNFDASVPEFFLPLVAGARVVVARPEGHKDPAYLIDIITRELITIIHFAPSMLRVFLGTDGVKRCSSLRNVISAGEALPADLVNRFHACSSANLHNIYGPTETTVAVTCWTCPRRDGALAVSIGRPEANTQCYILDQHLQPVPAGVPGELHIGGIQVGRGYHNRPDLTAEKFIPDPFSREPGGRLYKTGDLCRFHRDGNIEFLGRMDQQVKMRGFRIELGEIEAALKAAPQIREVAVDVRKDSSGYERLVAYIVPRDGAKSLEENLRAALGSSLPDYMVPTVFVQMERLPLSPNDKLDRKALPAPESRPSGAMTEHVPARNRVEAIVSEIWAEVLGVERVGVFQNFFELGGHSLSAAQMIARLKARFQTEIPLRSVFSAPTIAELASHIMDNDGNGAYQYCDKVPHRWKRLIMAQPRGSRPPLYLVAGFMDADDSLRVLSTVFPHLGLDQPLLGFQPRWLDGHSPPYSSVEEVAREFVDELRSFQPEGPYFLGGECIGGVVALEMAQEILRQGAQVGSLLMYDTQRPSWIRGFSAEHEAVVKRATRVADVVSNIISGKNGSRFENIRDIIQRKLHGARPPVQADPRKDPLYPALMAFQRMVFRHRVSQYPGRITLIVSEQTARFDRELGWRGRASGGLEVVVTPGSHWSRYGEHSKEYSERIRECLERAQIEFVQSSKPPHSTVETRGNVWGEDVRALPYTGTRG